MFIGKILRRGATRLVKNLPEEHINQEDGSLHEFCPNCEANLTLQKGYSNDLPYWICRGCGEMLINPEVDAENNISWICDNCGSMLNTQYGFSVDCGEWKCTECGHVNPINSNEVYVSEDEYRDYLSDPYKGISDEDMLELSSYQEILNIDGREDVILVINPESGEQFIKKILTIYNKSIYEYLIKHPVFHMPKVKAVYESDNALFVLEEYIEGKTLAKCIEEGAIEEDQALKITIDLCKILDNLHNLPTPMIHRDVKPSNVMLTSDNEVYLLDMNVARWSDPNKSDDTRYMGTQNYAAPEQVGYGLTASSPKSDIYAVGMLFNVMLTGDFPKYKSVTG